MATITTFGDLVGLRFDAWSGNGSGSGNLISKAVVEAMIATFNSGSGALATSNPNSNPVSYCQGRLWEFLLSSGPG